MGIYNFKQFLLERHGVAESSLLYVDILQRKTYHRFIEFYEELGWKDIGVAYYRMDTGTVMPNHSDRYVRYINLFNLQGREHLIRRALVFLEDWKSGHYLEAMDEPVVGWKAGQVTEWTYDTPHMAANIGLEPRYTLQITGHL